MGCCGSSGKPQAVRRQTIAPTIKAQSAGPQKGPMKIHAAKPVNMQRQYAIARQQCVKCGYPTMIVHIANRERHQCSNANCKLVAQ